MKFTSALCAAALSLATLFGAPQVNAATVTFEFDKATTGWADALNYSQSGLDLQVTGKMTNGGSARVATWTGSGLGLCNPIEGLLWCPGWKDQHAIDNTLGKLTGSYIKFLAVQDAYYVYCFFLS